MEAGWGKVFVEQFRRFDAGAIATILTRDNREFFARQDEIEVLETFPTAWIVADRAVIPESEIVRVEIAGERDDG